MTRVVITGLVAIHLAASIWHGSAHTQLAITLTPEQSLFVYVVIVMAPVAAAALVWTRHFSVGVWVLFLSMLGALLFGVYHHYIVVSPDNIGHLPSGSPAAQSRFVASAAAIALLELASALYAAFCLARNAQQRPAH